MAMMVCLTCWNELRGFSASSFANILLEHFFPLERPLRQRLCDASSVNQCHWIERVHFACTRRRHARRAHKKAPVRRRRVPRGEAAGACGAPTSVLERPAPSASRLRRLRQRTTRSHLQPLLAMLQRLPQGTLRRAGAAPTIWRLTVILPPSTGVRQAWRRHRKSSVVLEGAQAVDHGACSLERRRDGLVGFERREDIPVGRRDWGAHAAARQTSKRDPRGAAKTRRCRSPSFETPPNPLLLPALWRARLHVYGWSAHPSGMCGGVSLPILRVRSRRRSPAPTSSWRRPRHQTAICSPPLGLTSSCTSGTSA